MKKIVVPDGMLKAATNEFFKAASLNGIASATDFQRLTFALEAALRWLVEQEIGDPMLANIVNNTEWSSYRHTARTPIHAYLNRMFFAPEPEVPEEIKDLLEAADKHVIAANRVGEFLVEAYRRGKESK